jgi:predicted hotdog family 3-hydroxylacyl-ACP dehydratase
MDPSEYNIIDLIPQRPPMVMIDQLTYAGEKSAKGRLIIQESNLFVHNGKLQEAGLVEFIAQTAAAYTGYVSISNNQEVKKGFIGSVKNLLIHSLPDINTEIKSEIIKDTELLGFTIITGRVFQNDKVLAECEMRILLDKVSK